MPELSPAQINIVMRLASRGFAPATFPLYTNAVGIRRGAFAVLLEADGNKGLRAVGQPCYMVDGNLGVCVEQDGGRWFVWKSKRVEATAELLAELKQFSDELAESLLPGT
jgi:hypothetical protein